jgi:F-type H+-transporting ATPase subunit epsilon
MARTLLAEIVTPERIVYANEVLMVVSMTPEGEIGILPLHAPLVTTLSPGEVRLQCGASAAECEVFSISGGYMQVHEDKVIILADAAVAVSQIDKARVEESLERVKERLAGLPAEAEDERIECERDMYWCEVQIKTAEKHAV